ncbi:MAG: hypothetical protein AABW46_00345 [Nanoarchaeota archaeon]
MGVLSDSTKREIAREIEPLIKDMYLSLWFNGVREGDVWLFRIGKIDKLRVGGEFNLNGRLGGFLSVTNKVNEGFICAYMPEEDGRDIEGIPYNQRRLRLVDGNGNRRYLNSSDRIYELVE